LKNLYTRLLRFFMALDFFGPLLARLTIGYVFATSGYGKLTNLERVISYFESLQIPAPKIQAPFIASLEVIGGIFVLLGFGTRVMSALLGSIMLVALVTAKKEALESFSTLSETSEYLYLVLLVWLVVAGAGRFSVDAWAHKKISVET
jgi:putative oxidoreductase